MRKMGWRLAFISCVIPWCLCVFLIAIACMVTAATWPLTGYMLDPAVPIDFISPPVDYIARKTGWLQ